VRVGAGELVAVTLAPPAKTEAAGAGGATGLIGPKRPEQPNEPGSSRRPLSPVVAIVGGVLTLVAGGLAVASGLDTQSKRDAFPNEPTQERLDEAFASQTRTNVLIGTTAGLGVITGVIAIFFTDWDGRADTRSGVGASR
jgi:hypothetical protein